MRYTVVWLPPAEDQLTLIWMRTSDRQAVSDASDRIDRELANDPDSKGSPMGVCRVFRVVPLEVLYTVDPGDCMVKVIQARRV